MSRNSFGPIYLSNSGNTQDNQNAVLSVGADDVDIFPISITETGVYDLQSLSTSTELGELNAETVLVLYDEEGNQIASSQPGDNVVPGINTRIIRQLDAGNYFLVVLPEGISPDEYSFSDQQLNLGDSPDERLSALASSTGDYSLRLEPFNLSATSSSNSNNGSFAAAFNAPINQEPLALYDGPDEDNLERPSVTVVDAAGNPVRGSLVFDDDTQQYVFVPSDPFSISGSYTITYSGSDFTTTTTLGGQSLSDDIENTIEVTREPDAGIVAIRSFARGPGQDVNIGDDQGIPVIINDAEGLTEIRLRIEYDPDLLDITEVVIDPDISGDNGDWSIDGTAQIANGEVLVDISGTTALTGETELINLIASVPADQDIFNESQVIRVSGGATNTDDIPVIIEDSTAIHKVAFLADANGAGGVNFNDAVAVASLSTSGGVNGGFDLYDLTDPSVLADINNSGGVPNFNDAVAIASEVLGLSETNNIPDVDSDLIPPSLPIDPTVRISSATTQQGQQVTVSIDVTDDTQGLSSFALLLDYDTNLLDITADDIVVSQVVTDNELTGFPPPGITVNDNEGTVTLGFANFDPNAGLPNGPQNLANLTFTAVGVGEATLDLVETRGSATSVLGRNAGSEELTPLFLVDGSITVTDVPDNQPPTAVTIDNAVANIDENTDTTNRIKIGDIQITDDDLGTGNITLAGDDAASFEVDGTELFLRAGTNLDFETKESFNFTVQVDDPEVGATPDATTDVILNVSDINEAPTAVTIENAVANIDENTDTTNRIKIADIQITDDDLGTNNITLAGDDAASFEVDGTELFLRAGTNLDFETKESFNFTVQVDDPDVGQTPDVTTDVTLNVNDIAEPLTTIELYRFRNTTTETGTYLYVGIEERDNILADPDLNQTFELEGVNPDGSINLAFTASTQPGENLEPFYRLSSLDNPGTFLFAGQQEYDAIFAEGSDQRDKWEQQGFDTDGNDIPEFYLYGVDANLGTPFNRFQNRANNSFLFAGPEETAAINSDPNFSAAFLDQGGAFESIILS